MSSKKLLSINRSIDPYIVLIVTIIAILGLASYWGYEAKKETTKEATRATYEFSEAVRKVTSDSISLEIESYVSGKKLIIHRNDPEFEEILRFLNNASTVRVVSKTQVADNQTVEVTIPYPYGIFLTFKSKDEAEVWFNSVSIGELWFESDEAIYEVSVNPSLNDVLSQLLSGASAAPQPPQSNVPIATTIIIIVTVAVIVAALGFFAIRKTENHNTMNLTSTDRSMGGYRSYGVAPSLGGVGERGKACGCPNLPTLHEFKSSASAVNGRRHV